MPIGPLEVVLVLAILLVLFGASRLPKMGREIGRGIRGFRDELSHGLKENETESEEDAAESEERTERKVPTPRAIERH
jgi:sec-independent protein translocase protein TatA